MIQSALALEIVQCFHANDLIPSNPFELEPKASVKYGMRWTQETRRRKIAGKEKKCIPPTSIPFNAASLTVRLTV